MSFLNPLMLWGLLGVSIPVLAHLLNLYRFRETDWAAMRFLARAAQVRSRQIRLKDILLMLLRCLAVLLLVLALSRPVLRSGSAPPLGESRAGVVIGLDGSYSMMHEFAGRSRFDRAVERARQIGETVKEGDPVSLVLLGTPNRVLLRNVPFSAERFASVLDEVQPLAEAAGVEALPDAVEPLLDDMKVAQKEVYLITDVQARDWNSLSGGARTRLRRLAERAAVQFAPVRAADDENVAVTDLHLASGVLRRDSIARYTAKVHNFGRQVREKVRVTCSVDGMPVDESLIGRLEPRETATVSLLVPLTTAGRKRISAVVDHDALPLDDVRYEVAHVRERLRVLCVDRSLGGSAGEDVRGDPSFGLFRGAADYLMTALTVPPNGSASAPLDPERISWSALSGTRFEEYDVVMLADVPEIPEGLVPRLYDYVRSGGGLVIFVGEHTQPDQWNQRLGSRAVDLLPAELSPAKQGLLGSEDSWPLDTALPDHRLCETLRGLASEQLGSIRFERYMELKPVADARVVLRVAPGADPLLVERSVGRGRVALFASTANRDWHNMVVNPAFPMLVHQLVSYVTRDELEKPVPVGQPIVVSLDDMEIGSEVTFIEPDGRLTGTQTVDRQGRTVGIFERTEQVGFHYVKCRVATPAFLVAVNPQTAESDVQVLGRERREDLARELGMDVMMPEGSAAPAILSARIGQELWLPLMVLAVAATVGESLLARHITGRRAPTTRRS